MIESFSNIIRSANSSLKFTFVEIGALRVGGPTEQFHQILDLFPGSKIIGFEVDENVCRDMNLAAREGVTYYPCALGERNEKRDFHITEHPMCCSLYKPNESFISLYSELQCASLKEITTIDTVSLDYFLSKHDVGAVDFIKVDVQGASLDIFKGAPQALKDVLAIVSEVEFVPIYHDQPLFGDVSKYLDLHQLMFNKFLSLAGRTLRPLTLNNDSVFPAQYLWSDAFYMRHIQKLETLSDEQLLKFSVLTFLYNSVDAAFFALRVFDKRHSSTLSNDWMKMVKG